MPAAMDDVRVVLLPTRHCCNRCSALLDGGELVAVIRFDGDDDPVGQRENVDAALRQLQADGLIRDFTIEPVP